MGTGTKPCILIIDDDESIRKYLRIGLEMWGFEVLTAETGALGVEIAGSRPIAVVLIDITLPDVDGFAVGRALRQIPALAHTRLIAMSGYDLTGEPEKLAEAGFEKKWLMKPFGPDELQKLLFDLVATGG
jgi:DNA-binding response OmpR family regulator